MRPCTIFINPDSMLGGETSCVKIYLGRVSKTQVTGCVLGVCRDGENKTKRGFGL